MTNKNFDKLLSGFLDDELDAAERKKFEALLTDDAALMADLRAYEKIDRLALQAVTHDPGEEYWGTFALRVRQRLDKEVATRPESQPASAWVWLKSLVSLPAFRVLAVVTPVLLLVFVGVYFQQHNVSQTLPSQIERPKAVQKITAAAPADKSSDSDEIMERAETSKTVTPITETPTKKHNQALAPMAVVEESVEGSPALDAPEPIWKTDVTTVADDGADKTRPITPENRPGIIPPENMLYAQTPYIKDSETTLRIDSTDPVSATPPREDKSPPDEMTLADNEDRTLRRVIEGDDTLLEPLSPFDGQNGTKGAKPVNGLGAAPIIKTSDNLHIPDHLQDNVRVVTERFQAGPFSAQFEVGTYSPSLANQYGLLPVLSQGPVMKFLHYTQDELVFCESGLKTDLAIKPDIVIRINHAGELIDQLFGVPVKDIKQVADDYVQANGANLFLAANELTNLDRVEMFPVISLKSGQDWTYYDWFCNAADQSIWVRYHSRRLPSTNAVRLGPHNAGDFASLWLNVNIDTLAIDDALLSRVAVVVWE